MIIICFFISIVSLMIKSKNPNAKFQTKLKFQISKFKNIFLASWDLEFDWDLRFVIWSLR